MGKTLYLECASGISGDMTVAALLDLGADREELERVLGSLPVGGFETEIRRVKKSGLDACDFSVKLDKEHENHDHDMEYLYGHVHEAELGVHAHGHVHEESEHGDHAHDHAHEESEDGDHAHGHVHESEHCGHAHGHVHESEHGDHAHGHVHEAEHSEHDHGHVHEAEHSEHDHGHVHEAEHGGHGHSHEHRGLGEILKILEQTSMTSGARELAVKIFTILGEAEAKAHGVSLEEVHFHEVGAVDSIVDIVAAAVCFDSLGITRTIIPEISEGKGQVRCQHGILPVPVPAVVNIAAARGLPLHVTDTYGELVTPTGAAIAAAIRTDGRLPERFVIEKAGLGAGKRNYERPSLLRAMLIRPEERTCPEEKTPSTENAGPETGTRGEEQTCPGETEGRDRAGTDRIYRLESNIDDCTGEALGYVMDRLLQAGARDVHYIPVFMKKNRPAWQLNVICDREKISRLEEIIFQETTTIGIRRLQLERHILPRESVSVQTPLGEAGVKVCTLPGGEKRYYPEYESAARLAEENGCSLQDAMEEIRKACR